MKVFDLRDDNEFVGILDIAEKIDCDERKVLEVFKTSDVLHVLAFDLQLYELSPGQDGRVNKEPVQSNDTDIPTRIFSRYIPFDEPSIAKIIRQGTIDCEFIIENNYYWGPKNGVEYFSIKIEDLFIKKKDVVFVAGKFKIAMEPVEYPLELTIALECYRDLYGNGIPDLPDRKKEALDISNWLRDNYTFMEEKYNINIRDRIAKMINPAPHGENKNIPQRK